MNTDSGPPAVESPAVQCAGLAKAYGGRAVLSGLDLAVRRGEVFGLVGANGGAKTTTLRMMAGLLAPDSGTCRVFGQAPSRVRHRIGVMPQHLSLYGHLTVAENLEVRAMLFGLARPGRAAADAMLRFGLAPYAQARVAHLSGGWARRAQFAAALIHDPDLLLLDEPTVGLDAAARQAVWAYVLRLAAGGTAVVVSTHDLAEAERFSRIVFLAGGRVRAAGTVAEVVAGSGVRSFLLRGPDAAGAAAAALDLPGVVAAYPSAGALRLVTRPAAAGQAAAVAGRHGLALAAAEPSLDDAAQALLHAPDTPDVAA